ncbi:MAG: type IVB secretion system protein IcmH/DotU [Kiloniellales bacterium]
MTSDPPQPPEDPDATIVVRRDARPKIPDDASFDLPGQDAPPEPQASRMGAEPAKPEPAPPQSAGQGAFVPAGLRASPYVAPEPPAAVGAGGGTLVGAAAPIPPEPPSLAEFQTGVNPLVRSASTLLELSVRLRNRPTHPNVQQLHERCIAEVRSFESLAAASGVAQKQIEIARYALCATLDDVVLNTPWGGESLWAGRTLVNVFHRETFGGERFFDLLKEIQADPARNLDLLELMYLCLSLGFQGQLRLSPDGAGAHSQLRESLYTTIRRQRGTPPNELSPQWRGVAAAARRPGERIPLWMIGGATLLLLLLLFGGFYWILSRDLDRVLARIEALPPRASVEISHLAVPPAAETTLYDRLNERLSEQVSAGLIALNDEPGAVALVVNSENMFASGDDQVTPAYAALIDAVGQALAPETALVLVIGHTDDRPIRTQRFPNNLTLSLARAEAVRDRLAQRLADPERLAAEGRGAGDPVASNATAEGRSRNRRIEITVLKAP